MKKKTLYEGWQTTEEYPDKNQLRILCDSLHESPTITRKPSKQPFNNIFIKKCLTQQSQSPNYREFNRKLKQVYQRQLSTKRQSSPTQKDNQFNFSVERQSDKQKKFNNCKVQKNGKPNSVVLNVQRYQKQQLRNKLLMISKDLNNTQINHIIQFINK